MLLSRLSAAAAVAALLLSVGAALAVAQAPPTARPPQTLAQLAPRIPDVVGKTIDSAITALAFTRLPIIRLDTTTAAQPRGRVVAQRPGRETLVRQAKAETLWVANPARRLPRAAFVPSPGVLLPHVPVDTPSTHVTPPRDTVVPDLFGRTPNLVSAALEMSRLRPGRVFQDSSDQMSPGRAFRQDPLAGTRVGLGRTVDVWYSLGPHHAVDMVSVPPIEGRSIDEARVILRRRSLMLGRVATEYRRDANGSIVHQEPHAGAPAHRSDSVDVTVALAPPLIAVPNVIGLSRAEARARIEAAGLDVGGISVVTRAGATATIDSQRPAADTRVEPHSLIDLVEAQAPIVLRAVVPDLRGKTQAGAERSLRADSLELGTVVRSNDDSTATVVAQDPPRGQSVVYYSRVNVRIGPPPQQPDSFVRVPRVVNFTVGDAQRALTAAGLSRIVVTGDSATASAVVVSQSLSPGTLVHPDALISLAAERVIARRVPELRGRREADARAEAERDRFFMQVANRHRKIRLTEVVVSQTPAAGNPDRGDQRVEVDLDIPVVPPLPAAIVLGVVGTVAEILRRRNNGHDDKHDDDKHDDHDVEHEDVVLTVMTPPPDVRTFSSSDADGLIRSVVEFSLELDAPAWDIEGPRDTLISSEKVRNA